MSEERTDAAKPHDAMTAAELQKMEFFLRAHLRRRLFLNPSNPPSPDLMLGRLVDLVCQLRVATGANEISAQRLWKLAMGDEAFDSSRMSKFKSGLNEDNNLAARADKMVGAVLLGENRRLLRVPAFTRRPQFVPRVHDREQPTVIATRIMRLLFSTFRPRSSKQTPASESQAPHRQGFLHQTLPVPFNSYEARSELIALGYLARLGYGHALVVRCSGLAAFPQTKHDGQLTRSGEETINLLSIPKTAVIYVFPKGTEAEKSFCAFKERAKQACTQQKLDEIEFMGRLIAVELPPNGSSITSPMFRWIWHQVVEPNHDKIENLSGTATVSLGTEKNNEPSFDPAKEALDAFPHLLIQRFETRRETIEPFASTAFEATSDEKDRFRETILSQVLKAARESSESLRQWPDPCAQLEA